MKFSLRISPYFPSLFSCRLFIKCVSNFYLISYVRATHTAKAFGYKCSPFAYWKVNIFCRLSLAPLQYKSYSNCQVH